MTLLSTKNLSKSFGGIQAVSGVDFELREGEIRALIGPNGAGKTTFVGLLCGRITADTGQVYFCNNEITNLPAHKRISMGIGYTFQITSIFSKLSVSDNISLALCRDKANSSTSLQQKIDSILDKIGLTGKLNHIAGDMSYGHQRLLEIAMGLSQNPKLLILDEPTQGLAQGEISNFISLLKSVSGKTTILLIEHNMDVVMGLADQITVLNFGRILAQGKPAQIRENNLVQQAYLGNTDA